MTVFSLGTRVVLVLGYRKDELYDIRKQRTCMFSIFQMGELGLCVETLKTYIMGQY